MSTKPLNPKLPGKYGRMTREEFDDVVSKLNRRIPASETRLLTQSERKQWQRAKRRPGRPRRGKGVRVISLSVEQSLLDEADRAARKHGISRAALFEMGVRTMLARAQRKAG